MKKKYGISRIYLIISLQMEKIDLHIHTIRSDGICTEKQIIELALKNNVKIISVTDHDNVNALSAVQSMADDAGIAFIPGIEFSIDSGTGELHLLGYGIDYKNEEIVETADGLSRDRELRAREIIRQLRDSGIDITYEEVVETSVSSGSMGKPHIARLMLQKGYVRRIDQAFRLYFKHGLPGDVPKKKISLERGIRLIVNAGGIPVLAHPGSLDLSEGEFLQRLDEFEEAGLRGIEVFASMHSRREVRFFEKTALERNLLVTGGSDFHGDRRENLGYFGRRRIDITRIYDFLEAAGIYSPNFSR